MRQAGLGNIQSFLTKCRIVVGIVEFDVKNRYFAFRTCESLQGIERQKLPASFSVFNNAADSELVVKNAHHVPNFFVR